MSKHQDLTVNNAIKLYEIFCNNSKDAVYLHTKHAQGFLTLIIAVIAATIAGLRFLEKPGVTVYC